MDTMESVERTLGILLAKVEGIERTIVSAEAHRDEVHARIDKLGGEVATIKADIIKVKDAVIETKRVTDDVERWKHMGMGALAVTGLASSAVTALFIAYGSAIIKAVRGY